MKDHYSMQMIGSAAWIMGLAHGWAVYVLVFLAAVAAAVLGVFFLRRRKNKCSNNNNWNKSGKTAIAEGAVLGNSVEVTERILAAEKKCRIILFAGANVSSLPITVPVNSGIELAKRGKRCFLIDLDVRRDALAKAFGIDSEWQKSDFQARSYQSELENLWIWPSHNFIKLRHMNVAGLVKQAMEKFDLVLINAPYLLSSPDRRYIASTCQGALIFSGNKAETESLCELMKEAGTMVIARVSMDAEGQG
ncbi:MAG: hypothetical protein ABIG61_08820 [Planctomycetota bacterium]